MIRIGAAIGLGFALVAACAAYGAPPPGVDMNGPIAKWVQSWHDTTGFPCCGISTDCRPTIIRPDDTAPSGYRAWIGKEAFGDTAPDDWRPIPITAFSSGSEQNPSGVSFACWYRGNVVCASIAGGY